MAQLKIGYLKCYGGQELKLALAAFSAKYPDVDVQVFNGNHEDLYNLIRTGGVDLVLNDQRRAFSEDYVNFELITTECSIEIAGRNPIASLEKVEITDLKNIPCILIAFAEQQETESAYYRKIVGFDGEFIFAENLEEARIMVISDKSVMLIEGGSNPAHFAVSLCRIPLYRNGNSVRRKYCAFWKIDNSGYYVEEFAELLKKKFSDNKQ